MSLNLYVVTHKVYRTQNRTLFIAHQNGFNMDTGEKPIHILSQVLSIQS